MSETRIAHVPGKTRMRDVLYERRGLSYEEAEAMCDRLEKAGAIRFRADLAGEMGWHIDPTALAKP